MGGHPSVFETTTSVGLNDEKIHQWEKGICIAGTWKATVVEMQELLGMRVRVRVLGSKRERS